MHTTAFFQRQHPKKQNTACDLEILDTLTKELQGSK